MHLAGSPASLSTEQGTTPCLCAGLAQRGHTGPQLCPVTLAHPQPWLTARSGWWRQGPPGAHCLLPSSRWLSAVLTGLQVSPRASLPHREHQALLNPGVELWDPPTWIRSGLLMGPGEVGRSGQDTHPKASPRLLHAGGPRGQEQEEPAGLWLLDLGGSPTHLLPGSTVPTSREVGLPTCPTPRLADRSVPTSCTGAQPRDSCQMSPAPRWSLMKYSWSRLPPDMEPAAAPTRRRSLGVSGRCQQAHSSKPPAARPSPAKDQSAPRLRPLPTGGCLRPRAASRPITQSPRVQREGGTPYTGQATMGTSRSAPPAQGRR
ncbi:hypothetical protein H1C71_039785 [Ictidomys tridecemlineatus]|nr:hypothetical protein H1C71_039785 [Ictidomys tridecemlineatus]